MNSTSPEIPTYTMATGFPPMGPNNTAYDLIASQFAARIVSPRSSVTRSVKTHKAHV